MNVIDIFLLEKNLIYEENLKNMGVKRNYNLYNVLNVEIIG